MTDVIIKKSAIDAMEGLAKKHFLNSDARPIKPVPPVISTVCMIITSLKVSDVLSYS